MMYPTSRMRLWWYEHSSPSSSSSCSSSSSHFYLCLYPIQSLVVHCHTLRHISFLGGSVLSDRAFKHLALENRKLKSIRIESKLP